VRFSFIVNLLEERSKQQDWAALRKRRASTSTSHGTQAGRLGHFFGANCCAAATRALFWGALREKRKRWFAKLFA